MNNGMRQTHKVNLIQQTSSVVTVQSVIALSLTAPHLVSLVCLLLLLSFQSQVLLNSATIVLDSEVHGS